MLILLLFMYSISAALGMVLMKRGGKGSHISNSDKRLNINLDYELFFGIVLYVVSFILWIIILQLFPIVYISPIAYGLNFVFIAFLAFVFLKERISFTEVIGVIIIIVGVIFVSFKF